MMAFISAHALPAIVLLLLIEEIGIPILVPGDLLLLLAGINIREGHSSLGTTLVLEEMATVAGAFVLYTMSARLRRSVLPRYGRYVGLSPERLVRVQHRVEGRQALMVFLGRLVPSLRIVTSASAGIIGVPRRRFLPAMAVGGFLYVLICTVLGILLGPTLVRAETRVESSASVLVSIAATIMLPRVIRRVRNSSLLPRLRNDARITAVVGLCSGLAALVVSHAVVGVLRFVYWLQGRTFVVPEWGWSRMGLLLGWPVFLALAVVVAMGCSLIGRRSRWSAHGLLLLAAVALVTVLLFESSRHLGTLNVSSVQGLEDVDLLRWAAFTVILAAAVWPGGVASG